MKKFMLVVCLLFSSAISAEAIPKQLFIALYSDDFTEGFCSEKGIGVTCFSLSNDQCLQSSRTAVQQCVETISHQIPPEISSEQEAWKWGAKIGMCAGRKYRLENTDKITYSTACSKILMDIIYK